MSIKQYDSQEEMDDDFDNFMDRMQEEKRLRDAICEAAEQVADARGRLRDAQEDLNEAEEELKELEAELKDLPI